MLLTVFELVLLNEVPGHVVDALVRLRRGDGREIARHRCGRIISRDRRLDVNRGRGYGGGQQRHRCEIQVADDRRSRGGRAVLRHRFCHFSQVLAGRITGGTLAGRISAGPADGCGIETDRPIYVMSVCSFTCGHRVAP